MPLLSDFDCIPVCERYLEDYFLPNDTEVSFVKSHWNFLQCVYVQSTCDATRHYLSLHCGELLDTAHFYWVGAKLHPFRQQGLKECYCFYTQNFTRPWIVQPLNIRNRCHCYHYNYPEIMSKHFSHTDLCFPKKISPYGKCLLWAFKPFKKRNKNQVH